MFICNGPYIFFLQFAENLYILDFSPSLLSFCGLQAIRDYRAVPGYTQGKFPRYHVIIWSLSIQETALGLQTKIATALKLFVLINIGTVKLQN